MHLNWHKNMFGIFLYLGALFVGCAMFGGAAFASSTLVATQELASPGNVPGYDADKKTAPVVDDVIPAIELPDKLEILPPVEDGHQHDAGQNNSHEANPDQENVNDRPQDLPPPPIERDVSKLPVPVAKMRELIMEAARAGRVEDLRPLIGSGENITVLSLGGIEGDPIEFFKSLSGDDNGHEILAILLEVLEAGYVRMDAGTDNELYVWPYFFAWPLDKLTPVQKVELFRIVTAGDYEDMQSFGGYIFYRVGISPKGRWQFFVAGD